MINIIIKKIHNLYKKIFGIGKFYSNILFLLSILFNTILLTFFYLLIYSIYIEYGINNIYFLIGIISLILIIKYKNNLLLKINKDTLITRILKNILTKNYIFIIQKIIFIKIIILYIYISSDYSYCDSIITKTLHNTFMELGKSIGIESKTNVSILETIGIMTIIGGIGYGAIKGYEYMNGIEHKSINTRLDELENKLDYVMRQNNELLLLETNIAKGVAGTTIVLETEICKIGNDITNKINEINNHLSHIESNQITSNELNVIFEKLRVEFNSNIEQIKHRVNNIIINNEDIDKNELINLYSELNRLNTKFNSSISEISANELTSKVLRQSIGENLIREELYKPVLPSIIPKVNSLRSNALRTLSLPIRKSESIEPQLSLPQQRDLYKLESLDTDKFVFSKVYNEAIQEGSTSALSTIVRRVANGIPVDVMLKVVTATVSQAISNSITISSMLAIFHSIGLGSEQSSAENMGKLVIKNIKDFIKGIKNG